MFEKIPNFLLTKLGISAIMIDDIKSYSMEKYSSGRRGVTRNLVGRESVAWVQIPPSPPNKNRNSDTKGLRFLP